MELLRLANLALAFVLELCALAAVSVWGYRTGATRPVQLVLAIGAPLVLAVLWGRFAAPRASRPLREPWRLLFKLAVFGLAACALVAAGHAQLGLAFALVVAINLSLGYVWPK